MPRNDQLGPIDEGNLAGQIDPEKYPPSYAISNDPKVPAITAGGNPVAGYFGGDEGGRR
jgi:hypothetical protein